MNGLTKCSHSAGPPSMVTCEATPSSSARASMYARSSAPTPPVSANTVCTDQPRSFRYGTQKLVSRPPEKARTMSLLMMYVFRKSGVVDDDARLATHREIDGRSDEARVMCVVVRGYGLGGIAAGRDRHHRMQHHFGEMPAVALGDHRAFGDIGVGRHHHAGKRGDVQIGQHVAGGKRSHQHVFRIVFRGVAAERRVGRTGDVRLALDADHVLAAVVAITIGAGAAITGPLHVDAVVMLMTHHAVFSVCAARVAITAFCTCRRFSASSIAMQYGASITASVALTLRRSGRQWLNTAWLVSAILASSTMKCLCASRIGLSSSQRPKNGSAPQLFAYTASAPR